MLNAVVLQTIDAYPAEAIPDIRIFCEIFLRSLVQLLDEITFISGIWRQIFVLSRNLAVLRGGGIFAAGWLMFGGGGAFSADFVLCGFVACCLTQGVLGVVAHFWAKSPMSWGVFTPRVGIKAFCELFLSVNLLPWLIIFIALLVRWPRSGELALANYPDIFSFFWGCFSFYS